ncbi:MotA/TolQ/ExbB proton channel family protein [Halopseudomonas nanhaiensis]|uniref:MotA/TolQ/ExbB proton channel family protein n=1 Tax=Halopseudomonas nanhaiensis TaxID=2830842 RepID=UPI001CBCFA26|nr:MotA/TolQ/ExbB proton channel family protein [Halopseudomonas nanhaiensis]UAW98685.1 MotA/TolQ/ExbB proton channel family protein [Halopseudomonas nanhaiensis]
MFDSQVFAWLHLLVGWLLKPVTWGLFALLVVAVVDIGIAIGERFGGLARWALMPVEAVERLARRRLDRADLIGRVGPMLGLMGTLIPLGPGLAALGDGNVQILSVAMRVAFDTTVLGLLAGVLGFALSRLRRRWYDDLLDAMEAARQQERSDEPTLAL